MVEFVKCTRALFCPTLVLAVAQLSAMGGDASFFREHSGVAADDAATLPADLNDADSLVWRREMLAGNSTPCVCGDLIVLTTYDEANEQLATVAIERDSGEVRLARLDGRSFRCERGCPESGRLRAGKDWTIA